MWPFGKKNAENDAAAEDAVAHGPDQSDAFRGESAADTGAAAEADYGPFDGQSVDIEEFDFSDFSLGTLDLGSMKIALPKPSQVQVEMGEKGPRMLHIVTEHGRITPVAFAAAASQPQWPTVIDEIRAGMENDGLTVHSEQGPWGTELVGVTEQAQIRMIGCDGPRWMLRTTLVGPKERADQLRDLARDVLARTFVYRGDQPMMAGNSLPVVLPEQLVSQVQEAMAQRKNAAQEAQQQNQQRQAAQALAQYNMAQQNNAAAQQDAAQPNTAHSPQPPQTPTGEPQVPTPEESEPGSGVQQVQELNKDN
ncbi:hypothetical protein CCICO_06715 [Corynebacterium ciconiae DSM 44920]|uniref:DUF3710 domain-containing protein n=1 Tax=Corynebacterium ciconiae TaxID=227319 RepID=UPI00035EA97F|nr:DUF3710 domain-containing protein [Corynebacterium ciconiae]WKD61363.1 hypothetical protein CCICO_06715 [Corynebacterium ciconiae DSM 44920]